MLFAFQVPSFLSEKMVLGSLDVYRNIVNYHFKNLNLDILKSNFSIINLFAKLYKFSLLSLF